MTDSPTRLNQAVAHHPADARKKLEAAASLHWFHWIIIAFSLLLTFFAWSYSKSELEARVKAQFDREADQVCELVLERMRKYEDALWSGVAFIDTVGEVDYQQWTDYANRIDIKRKYPGINGIGVIHSVAPEELPEYLSLQRGQRPDYSIHPSHDRSVYMPISYIVPVEGNEVAVGLDIAHESNRFRAAQQARDTGKAQITGPITLVQDSSRTPGFLFYAPFYHRSDAAQADARHTEFAGMVYAPFIMRQLMEGTLDKDRRHVGIRVNDGDQVLYDEHVASEHDYDPDPLFKRSVDIPLYGRTWSMDIWSAKSFRAAASDGQPLTILIGGIFIDTLLIILFVLLTRASHRALGYADSMTQRLEARTEELQVSEARLAQRAEQLETSNAELEQFAYVASHDLQEPLRKICSYGELMREECGAGITESGHQYLDVMINGAGRLRTLVQDLLSFSRITTRGAELAPTSAADCLQTALEHLEFVILENDAVITHDLLPDVIADAGQLTQLFQNLIGNALKYRSADRPEIHIGCRESGSEVEFSVADNGIGIEPKFFDRIFEIFQRLHNRREYSGTGIGLAICKRIVDRFGGQIWVESTPAVGSTFYFTLQSQTHRGGRHDHPRCAAPVGAAY